MSHLGHMQTLPNYMCHPSFFNLYFLYMRFILWFCLLSYKGLVTLDEMKAKREDLVREHEKQLAAKLKSDEAEGLAEVIVNYD